MSYAVPIEDVVTRLLPIFSNLVFLYTANRYLAANEKLRAFLFFVVALFSSPVYHLCMGFPRTCFWSVYKYHVVDFWTAELSIPLVALMFVHFRDPDIEQWIIVTIVILIGILVTGTDSSLLSQAIIGGASLGIVVLYIAWHRRVHGYWPDYDIFQMILGIGFTALGVSFFIVQDWWPPYYGYMHSYWHGLVALGVAFFADLRRPTEDKDKDVSSLVTTAISVNTYIQRHAPFSVLTPKWQGEKRRASPVPPPKTFLGRFAFAPMDREYPGSLPR